MKDFFNIMAKDILKEGFTAREYLVYGVIAPVVMISICILAGAVE